MFSAIIKRRALRDKLDEDALTSLVFDTFKYLPPKYLKKFLEQATNLDKEKLGDVVPIPEETPEFYFWEFYPKEFLKFVIPEKDLKKVKKERTEPDLVMIWNNLVIVEESKWRSPKSSVDQLEEDESEENEKTEQDLKELYDQLAIEFLVAKAIAKKEKFNDYLLLYITDNITFPDKDIKDTIASIKRLINNEKEIRRRIFWTNWRNAVVVLEGVINNQSELNSFRKMAQDLFNVLKKLNISFPFQGFKFLEKLNKDDFLSEELSKSHIIFYFTPYWTFLEKYKPVNSALAEQEKIFYQGGKNG